MSFYNTNNLSPEELAVEQLNASNQDERIMEFLEAVGWLHFSASELFDLDVLGRAPLTSYRRSINTLMHMGLVTKTNETRVGMFGKPEHIWRRVLKPEKQPTLF